MFFENLARLRTRPQHERKLVAVMLSIGLTGVIVLVWLSVLYTQHKLDRSDAEMRVEPIGENDRTASWENMLNNNGTESRTTDDINAAAWESRYDKPGATGATTFNTTPAGATTSTTTGDTATRVETGATTTAGQADASPIEPASTPEAQADDTTQESRDIFNSSTP